MRRQNPLELVFEDISTFDAETPIVGSPLREIDIKKKQSDSDFIKSLPSQPGKEIEIKKRLDRLRGISRFDKKKKKIITKIIMEEITDQIVLVQEELLQDY